MRIAIAIALLTGLLLRFVEFSSPPYDAHAFRQTQTLSTVEFYFSQGIDIVHPRTLFTGYPGTLVLELPIFQALAAFLYSILGPHLEVIRGLNILFGAGTCWFLYRTVVLLLDRRTAVLTALIYWLAPLNIRYERSMLIDPLAVFCGLLSFYYLALLTSEKTRHYWVHFVLFGITTWLAAMMKALYLWPAVLLLACLVVARRIKPDLRAIGIIAVFVFAGISFLIWNHYAGRINDASPFTRGLQPTALIGFSALVDPHFYYDMLVRRPKWWLGVVGVLLYPIGLLAGWYGRHEPARTSGFLLFVLIPPTYLVLFSYINRPHDYYQLIITPFLSVVPASALVWVATRFQDLAKPWSLVGRLMFPALCAGILLAAPFMYVFWFHGGRPDPKILKFEHLCAGKIVPGSSGMVFASKDYAPPNTYIPELLYAARVWGYGRTVANDAGARSYFEEFAPEFPRLEYVILYGTDKPSWIPSSFHLASEDRDHRLYVFRHS